MTNTESISTVAEKDRLMNINPSTAEGRSRLLLFAGLGVLAIGNVINMGLFIWGGVGIVTIAFVLNTAGKLSHYRSLPISRRDSVLLSASWTLVAASVIALLANYTYTRYGAGDGSFFWSLAVAGLGFGLLHMAAQSKYLPETTTETDQ
ncbi:MAG: hypothetical protein SVG88_02210 [Halobacteriales archaeon]|nr:hypothetical protein [Halobacteriales archaeon]